MGQACRAGSRDGGAPGTSSHPGISLALPPGAHLLLGAAPSGSTQPDAVFLGVEPEAAGHCPCPIPVPEVWGPQGMVSGHKGPLPTDPDLCHLSAACPALHPDGSLPGRSPHPVWRLLPTSPLPPLLWVLVGGVAWDWGQAMLEARVLHGLREPLLTRNGAGEGLSQGPWHHIFTAVGLRQPEGRLTRGPPWSGRSARSGRWGQAAGGGPAWGRVSRGMSSKLLSPSCRAGEWGWGWDGRGSGH